MPTFATSRFNVLNQLKAAAEMNRRSSPIAGKLWSGTPISNTISKVLGKPAYAAEPYASERSVVPSSQRSSLPASPGTGGSQAPPGNYGGNQYSLPDMSSLYESPGEQPQFDYSVFDQAIAALDQIGQARQGEYGTDLSGIDTRALSQKQGINDQLTSVNKQVDSQQSREEQRTEASINELRRQESEQQQGIQALYGGTTGTGRFASELTSREVLKQVGTNRQSLQNVVTDLNQVRFSALTEANRQLTAVDQNSEQLRKEAKTQLDNDLAELNSKKYGIAMDREKMRYDAIMNYQQVVSSINQRNSDFKQKLYLTQQDFEQKLQQKRFDSVNEHYTDLQTYLERMVRSGNLTDQGLRYAEEQLGLGTGYIKQSKQASGSDNLTEDEKLAKIQSLSQATY